jgi:hypothetical protein
MSHQHEEDDQFDEDMDMPMEYDLSEALGGLLTNEEGQNIATIISDVKTSVDGVTRQLEMQNKILLKMLTAMNTRQPI